VPLEKELRLKVNEAKSAVARPEERKFLGFSISNDGSERCIAPKALDKFKTQIRKMTRQTRGISLPQRPGGSHGASLWAYTNPAPSLVQHKSDPPKSEGRAKNQGQQHAIDDLGMRPTRPCLNGEYPSPRVANRAMLLVVRFGGPATPGR
jgi:hypothetical protein